MDSLKDYLEKRGVLISTNQREGSLQQQYSEYNILEQIDIICELHRKIKDGDGIYLLRLQSNIGKEMEDCKVQLKRLKKMISFVQGNGIRDEFDKELLYSGPKELQRAERCIKFVEEASYIKLIKRSMKNNELCLTNCERMNLWKEDYIYIFDTSKLCFNMVEWDLITYLNKIKRRGINIDYGEAIDYFVKQSRLDNDSENYIRAMISYPYGYMKICERRREGKKKWSSEEYRKKLLEARLKDGYSLV
ncbi:spore coat protein [Clostridium sp. C8-1-8]|uniref:spore coat protein n=1 Tax=Clostridium sp. C8-1-8 TaxID=2698831 RepID=UPI001371441A|nr:spore coat protein [Clostridium sp. C8-1-8]